jgi:hypothetical protein
MPMEAMSPQAPVQPDSGSPKSGGVPALLGEVSKGLFKVAELFKDAGAPPELVQKVAQIANEYNSVIESIGAKVDNSQAAPTEEQPPAGPSKIPVAGNRPEESPNVRPVV